MLTKYPGDLYVCLSLRSFELNDSSPAILNPGCTLEHSGEFGEKMPVPSGATHKKNQGQSPGDGHGKGQEVGTVWYIAGTGGRAGCVGSRVNEGENGGN